MSRLEKLLALYNDDPNDTFVRYGIALEYSALKENAVALEWFEGLRHDAPDYVPTYYMLAGVYRALDKPEEARTVYQEGLRVARAVGDTHTFSELSAALEELDDE